MRWRQHSHTVSAYQPIVFGDNSHILQVRECTIRALYASDSVMIIGIDGEKKKENETKTELCLCFVNPPLHNALIPVHYAPISTVMYGAHDNVTVSIMLLRYPMHSIGVSP